MSIVAIAFAVIICAVAIAQYAKSQREQNEYMVELRKSFDKFDSTIKEFSNVFSGFCGSMNNIANQLSINFTDSINKFTEQMMRRNNNEEH